MEEGRNPTDVAMEFFDKLNKDNYFSQGESKYLEFLDVWKKPPSEELRKKIETSLKSKKSLESIFCMITSSIRSDFEKKENEN